MDAEKLNKALFEKMSAEQERYKHGLLGQTPEEVLNHAYEYAMREDILMEMEALDLPAPQAAALLESPAPLADVYKDFRDMETGHMDTVRECIEARADTLLEAQREKTRAIPLYKESIMYAKEHGEIDVFRASHQANISCRDAIEAAIRTGHDGLRLSHDAAKDVLAEFGPERVTHVLAATLLDRQEDGRFSRDTMAWAAAVPMFDTGNRRYDYAINSHPTVLNGFVGLARKEMDAMREQAEKKPSIKAQLAAKPVPGDQPTKPKDREAR